MRHISAATPPGRCAEISQLLPVEFYSRDPCRVAQDLLGMWLVRTTTAGVVGGRIVETEAYLSSDDPACHAAAGPNRKNRSMFGPPGRAYVYVIHARHCFNVVTESEGVGSAVLIRALEPLWGLDAMATRRGRSGPRELTTGPARLCEALAIDRSLDGHSLSSGSTLWIQHSGSPTPHRRRMTTPRIGVTSGQDLAYRYVERNNQYVSGPKRLRS